MFNRRLSSWIRAALLAAVLALRRTALRIAQEQKLPDAPDAPEQRAGAQRQPATAGHADDQGIRPPVETPERRQILAAPDSNRLLARPIRSRRLPVRRRSRRCPPGSVSNTGESGRDELFTAAENVSFVTVPVTVKDDEGKLVDGLLQRTSASTKMARKQKIKLFTSDPFPLSAALIIDQGMPDLTLKKVNQTFSALGGSFGPFDEVAVFTYGNTVNKRSGFRQRHAHGDWRCSGSKDETRRRTPAHRWWAALSVQVR